MSDTKTTLASKKRFQAQCFLTDYWRLFKETAPLAYSNFFIVEDNSAGFLMNKLTSYSKMPVLMNLAPYQYAALVPRVRLYKVYPSRLETPQEFVFPENITYDDIERIISSHSGQVSGVGLKSFTFELAGKNEASKYSNITAELSLRLQSMEDLLGGMTYENPKVKFLDLILPSDRFKANPYVYDPRYFRLKAVVGWAVPGASDLFTIDEINAIAGCTVTLNLGLMDHSFSFNQNGTIDMKVTYQAFLDSITGADSPTSNVLTIIAEGEENQKLDQTDERIANEERERALRKQRIDDADICAKDEKYAAKAKLQKEDDVQALKQLDISTFADKATLYRHFLANLVFLAQPRRIVVPTSDIGEWTDSWFLTGQPRTKLTRNLNATWANRLRDIHVRQNSYDAIAMETQGKYLFGIRETTVDFDRDVTDLGELLRDQEKAIQTALNETFVPDRTGESVTINYIYFGHILDYALHNLVQENSDLKVICGPIVFRDPRSDSKSDAFEIMNLADVPISLEYFMAWFTERIIKEQRYFYAFNDFLQDVLTEVVEPALTSACFAEVAPIAMTVNIDTFSMSAGSSNYFRLGESKRWNSDEIEPFLNDALGLRDDQYLVLHSRKLTRAEVADERLDALRGVAHFKIASDRGLVKKIEFSQESQSFAHESRISKEYGQAGQLARLRGKYNANITLHGNSLFYPGQVVYVDPTMMGLGSLTNRKDVANMIGLGGYFFVLKVENIIEAGKFETILTTKWEAMGDGERAPETVASENRCKELTNGISTTRVEKYNKKNKITDALATIPQARTIR